jgi:hypothetical protein
MLPGRHVLMIRVEHWGGVVDLRVGWSRRLSSCLITWEVGAVVGAGGRARLFWGCKLWAMVGNVEAVVVGCTGGTMTSDWGGRSGGP